VGGLGFEFAEGFEGTVASAAGRIDAVLEFGEGGGVGGGGISEGVLLVFVEDVVVLEGPHFGFDAVEAAEHPLAADEVVEEAAGFGGGGMVALVILVDEELEVGELLVGEEEGLGVESGFEGIHGRSGLACDRGGAGGFLGVAAVGFDLAARGHMGIRGRTGREACPTLTINGWFCGSEGDGWNLLEMRG
jgi:hypothetical protein